MMKTKQNIILAVLTMCLTGSLSAQTVLIDFGADSTYRGKSTAGNWNSVGGGYIANLIDSSGSATNIDYAPDGIGVTDSFNGPGYNGGEYTNYSSLTPTQQQTQIDLVAAQADTNINNAALGDLGVGTAAFDYYLSTAGRFQIQQLSAGQQYDLNFFSSKKFPTNDTSTTFSVYDDSGYSNLLGSVTLSHGSGSSFNTDSLGTISGLIGPSNSNNIFYIEYKGDLGGTGYINSMSLTAVPEPSTWALLALAGSSLLMLRRKK
jgi:hypothetical protein